MSYQVIARKWRPQAFEEVTGQEPITRTLRNAVEHERLHHAYVFSGARGVGKTTTARLFAKALNCHKSERPTPKPCRTDDAEQCASCREIAEGRSIDVLEIDAASNTKVEQTRDVIINTVGIAPARDRYKIFIIDEVHMLSDSSFNALLKTVEEPPPRVVFIMATTHAHKIPVTILSRAQQFEFRTIAAPRIFERLRLIADAEGIKVSDDALREIARAGEGSMRDAQSAFDQVISFSADAIEVADVETALGIAGAEMRARVMRAISEQRAADAFAVVEDLVMRGHDLRNFCRDLLAHVRDLLVFKVAGDSGEANESAEAQRLELKREADAFSESDLVRFFHSLTETEKALRESAHPNYQLEIGLVKLIEMRRLAPLGQILERLNALEENLRTGRAPAAANTGPAQPPPAATPARGGGSLPPRGTSGGSRSSSSGNNVSSTSSNVAAAAPLSVAHDASDAPLRHDASPLIADEADAPPFEPPPPRIEQTPRAAAAAKSHVEPQPLRTEDDSQRAEDEARREGQEPRVASPAATAQAEAAPRVEPPKPRPTPPSIPSLPKRTTPQRTPPQATTTQQTTPQRTPPQSTPPQTTPPQSTPPQRTTPQGTIPQTPLSQSAPPQTTPLSPPPASSFAPPAASGFAPAVPSSPPLTSPPSPPGLKLVPPSSGESANAAFLRETFAPASFLDASPDGNLGAQSDWFRADDLPAANNVAPPSAGGGFASSLDNASASRTSAAAPGKLPASPASAAVEQLKKLLEDRRKPFLVTALDGARKVLLDGDELYVEYAPEGKHLRDLLSKPDSVRMLRELCCETTGREMGVRIRIREAGESDDDEQLTQEDEARQEKQKLREMAEQHPRVQEVLRTFRAEIIDVRRVEAEEGEASRPV